MHASLKLLIVAAAGATALAAQRLPVASHGPQPAHTGGFGEPDCRACHFDYPLNDGAATIRLDGLPGMYEPEHTYTLRLVVRHQALERGGFQLAARFGDGTQAGRFELADTTLLRLQVKAGIEYLSHNTAGADLVQGDSVTWSLQWVAPPSYQRVTLHAAVNVANRDASEFGDRIFTRIFHAGPERVRK